MLGRLDLKAAGTRKPESEPVQLWVIVRCDHAAGTGPVRSEDHEAGNAVPGYELSGQGDVHFCAGTDSRARIRDVSLARKGS